ncbi:type II toxin-antitoxin system VapC family toxin [Pseudomonas sp. Au-Pse12]|uniref:type II toxin-antitoxin system VapC family toxin n=1 Tax=Pseudomonas sp. Au-Pse12 TaxID=2906459 RepID=UPI001E51242B|nr:type II toxin-antitoxin system VapC family toxin [Pseudomonas sp. Au-Pse12]MCE4055529.1 type II toxin-antitoxin system VapC family toxin [Pseudomonas sp. Au-Pse12]
MFLLDTNVISELRKPKANHGVKTWAHGIAPTSLFLSAITVLELETGILRVERRAPDQGTLLRNWLERRVLPAFAGRILAIDSAVALRCAQLHVPDRSNECAALIAATALVHGLTLVTRNVKDFEACGVRLLNPWKN